MSMFQSSAQWPISEVFGSVHFHERTSAFMFLLISFSILPSYVPKNLSVRYFPGDDFSANRRQNGGQYDRTCSERCKKIVTFSVSDAFRRSIIVASATASPRWALARTFGADKKSSKDPLNSASRGGVCFSHLSCYSSRLAVRIPLSRYIDRTLFTYGVENHRTPRYLEDGPQVFTRKCRDIVSGEDDVQLTLQHVLKYNTED